MIEIFQITAQYSNAVLVAIMPHVADFAQRLDLPIPQPVTTAQVKFFGCSPRSDHIGGHVVLTNGYEFSFDRGRVVLYRSPRSYFSLQDPDRIPEFYGQVKTTKKQAIQIAHDAIKKLGYTDTMLYSDRAPQITGPPKIGRKIVPRYRFKWFDPDQSPGENRRTSIDIEVDASTKQIQMMYLLNTNTRRPDPKVDVHPPVVGKGPETRPAGAGRKIFPVSQAYSNAFLAAILPQFNDYAKKAGFELKLPITTNDVDVSRYTCGIVDGDPIAFVDLNTGARFVYGHGQVIAFYAPDVSYLPGEKDRALENFFGPINMTTNQAMALVRETVSKLGYSQKVLHVNEPPTYIAGPTRWRTNVIARYFLNWKESHDGAFRVVAEVDATTKKLKSLYLNDHANTNIWREPPKVDVHPPVVGKGPQTTYRGGRKIFPVSQAYSNAFLVAILPQLSDFAKKVGFQIPFPVTTNQVDMSQLICGMVEDQPFAQIYLKTGECFTYRHGHVVAVYAANVFQRPDAKENRPEDFLGKVNLTPEAATALVRRTIRQLGYSEKKLHVDEKPGIAVPTKIGTSFFSRYFFYWREHGEEQKTLVWAEVDATTKSLTGLYINDYIFTDLQREPPKLDVRPSE